MVTMRSEDAVAAHRALLAEHPTTPWVEPLKVQDHLGILKRMLVDEVPGSYPQNFDYDRSQIGHYLADWNAFRAELGTAEMDDAIRARVLAEIDVQCERADGLSWWRDDQYAAFEVSHIGTPERELVSVAQAILEGDLSQMPLPLSSGDESNAAPQITSSDIQARMAAALTAYGLDDWSAVEEPNMAARASVNGAKRRIRVRTGVTATPHEADRLLAHEVGGHVLRWANSHHQPEAWVSIPLGQTVPTEEGMAVWREVEFGVQSERQLSVFAARVVAVDAARSEGIADVARRVLPYVGARDAAEIAMRVKRGLRDPNAPGGQTKDWGYLAGLIEMAKLAKEAPETVQLMAGVKWPMEDAPLVTELHRRGRVHLPTLLPDAAMLGLTTILHDH